MPSKSRDESFDGPQHQSAPDSQFSSPDELIGFAQVYFASDFPNFDGLNCPPKGILSGLLRGKAPDSSLRSHMFGCSECFGEYQDALAVYRAETKAVAAAAHLDSWRTRLLAAFSLTPVRVYVGTLALVVLVVFAAYVWREYRSEPEQIVTKRDSAPVVAPRENLSAPSDPLRTSPSPMKPVEHITPQSFPKQTVQQKESVPRPRVPSAERDSIEMSIDLGNYAVTRGGAGSSGEIKFPRKRTRLMLKLPEGSAKGFYNVSVVSALGNTLHTRKVRSTDGKTLAATLNMRRLAPEKYGLHISREGEPPVEVPIIILPINKP